MLLKKKNDNFNTDDLFGMRPRTEEPGGQEVGHRNGTEMCAHFKIKDPQSLLNAAAESSVTDGCAADDLSRCSFVSCAELALDPANFCHISARVELKPRLLYGVLQ